MRNLMTVCGLAATTFIGIGSISTAFAAVVGTEDFNSYANGTSLGGKNGGTGWTRGTNVKSAWRDSGYGWNGNGNSVTVNNGAATTTAGDVVFREFGGESGAGYNTDRPTYWFGNGASPAFFGVDVTISNAGQWGGLSLMDYNDEIVKLGWNPGQAKFAIEQTFGTSGTTTSATTGVASNVTYRLVGKLDWTNNLVTLWVNPASESSGAAVTRSVPLGTDNKHVTAVRLGGGSNITWDNLAIGTTFNDAVAVPEPTALTILGMGMLIGTRRRR